MKSQIERIQQGFHFVAMEYCWLILNRTYIVLIEDEHLVGIKVNGVVSIDRPGTADTHAVKGDLNNPYSYVKQSYLNKFKEIGFGNNSALSLDSANFRIKKEQIQSVQFNPNKKWGMSYYPHDGRVIITTFQGKREFIILGSQSGSEIADAIQKKLVLQ